MVEEVSTHPRHLDPSWRNLPEGTSHKLVRFFAPITITYTDTLFVPGPKSRIFATHYATHTQELRSLSKFPLPSIVSDDQCPYFIELTSLFVADADVSDSWYDSSCQILTLALLVGMPSRKKPLRYCILILWQWVGEFRRRKGISAVSFTVPSYQCEQ